jgi:hypothetical protein
MARGHCACRDNSLKVAIHKKLRCQAGLHLNTDKQAISPSREEDLLSDHLITIAGRSITTMSHDTFMTGISLVIGLVFWSALYFSRKRIAVLKRSSGIDQVTFELYVLRTHSSASSTVRKTVRLRRRRDVSIRCNRLHNESPKVWRILCLDAREPIWRHSELDCAVHAQPHLIA